MNQTKCTFQLILILGFITNVLQAQSFFKTINRNSITGNLVMEYPSTTSFYSIDFNAVKAELNKAPQESFVSKPSTGLRFTLPFPDGTIHQFEVYHYNLIIEAEENAFSIKTFWASEIGSRHVKARIDYTPWGFHAMIFGGEQWILINPCIHGNTQYYAVFDKNQCKRQYAFVCENDDVVAEQASKQLETNGNRTSGTQLRTYRLAMAATGEYTAYYGGTKVGALAGIVTSMNRVNGVYESEVDIRMLLIPNDTLIIYIDGNTDPYTNNSGGTMLGQNQTNCDAVIGTANYDIGHVFSTGGGGVASLNSPCSATTKARGVTGGGNPIGDPFDIDYVAHEIGHQFGGPHTFNAITNSCNGNRSSSSAYEPGSGITIQAYAGICGVNNLAPHSIPTFHVKSFNDLTIFTQTGSGNNCATIIATGNTPPVITSLPANKTIPRNTPFALTGAATDANNDTLTYCWEQFDLGPAGTWNAPVGNAPLFRPFLPVLSPTRTFPKISDIINNATTIGEILPSYNRNMTFKLTVRDNRPNGAGVTNNDTVVTLIVDSASGPFAVTVPNTNLTWQAGTYETVTWNVLSTNLPPVNCANVRLLLSTDGGNTYPVIINANTPNDGSEVIIVPDNPGTTNRIRVEAADNYFFDISNTNFTITAPAPLVINSGSITDAGCFGQSNGSISIAVSGGMPVYNYLWNNGSTLNTVSGLAAGTYTVTVTGTNGVSTSSSFTVNQFADIAPNLTQTNLRCFGHKNGVATVSPTGGGGAYTHLWSNGKTTASINNLIAGTYTCTITDANACTKTTAATITQPAQIQIVMSKTDATAPLFNNGTATATPSNGFSPYRYTWNTSPIQTTQTATALVAGNYVVTVKDNKKCARNGAISIVNIRQGILQGLFNMQVYPNPVQQVMFINLPESIKNKSLTCAIFNAEGKKVYEKYFPLASSQLEIDINQLATACYFMEISTSDFKDRVMFYKVD